MEWVEPLGSAPHLWIILSSGGKRARSALGTCLYNARQKCTVILHALSQWGLTNAQYGDLLLLIILFSCVVYEQMRLREAKEL